MRHRVPPGPRARAAAAPNRTGGSSGKCDTLVQSWARREPRRAGPMLRQVIIPAARGVAHPRLHQVCQRALRSKLLCSSRAWAAGHRLGTLGARHWGLLRGGGGAGAPRQLRAPPPSVISGDSCCRTESSSRGTAARPAPRMRPAARRQQPPGVKAAGAGWVVAAPRQCCSCSGAPGGKPEPAHLGLRLAAGRRTTPTWWFSTSLESRTVSLAAASTAGPWPKGPAGAAGAARLN